MMADLFEFLKSIILTAWSMLDSSSTWVIFSFIIAGLLHEFIKPEQMQKTAIGSKKFTGEGYRKMFWDYITSGKVDNQMSKFYVNVKDWNKLANWANKFVPGIGTTVVINQQSK